MDAGTEDRVARLAAWYRRLPTAVGLVWGGLTGLGAALGFVVAGPLPALGAVGIFILGDLSMLRIRQNRVFRTDAPTDAVREQFETLSNPATWDWIGWGDDGAAADGTPVTTDSGPEGATAARGDERTGEVLSTVTVSRFRNLFGGTVTLEREAVDGGDVLFRLRTDGRPHGTIRVSFESVGDGTRVTTRLRNDYFRPRDLLTLKLGEPIERQALSHLGYTPVESQVYIGSYRRG